MLLESARAASTAWSTIGASSIALFAQLDLAPRDAAHVEQVVHQTRHLADLTLQHFGRRSQRAPRRRRPGAGLARVADRGERVAQFVRQHRQELVLAAVGFRQVRRQTSQVVFQSLSFGHILAHRRESDRTSGASGSVSTL